MERVYSGEMLKRKEGCGERAVWGEISGWEGDKEMQGTRKRDKSKEQKLRKVKRGWPAERAKEIDRHSGGM